MIHQVYCTHCTYGTSALQRREGPTASETAGWDARAASVRGEELRRLYGQLGPFKCYALPRDARREDNLRFTALTAPRRLAYYPRSSANAIQMLGQVCHRPRDSSKEGRYGGVYFSHVLVSDATGPPWSVLDRLKLWDAPWVGEDSPGLPHDLGTLAEPLLLLGGAGPAVDDDVLWAFLKTPPGRQFRDPHRVIPERWKDRPAADRVALLRSVFEGYLRQRLSRRQEGVLLVAEPELAALLFYGIARLLPDGPLRQQISFSTYEPSPQRINVSLAATTFLRPEAVDLPREMYRGPAYAHNTFLDKSSAASDRGPADYVEHVFDILLSCRFEALDDFHAGLERVGIADVQDLDPLVRLRAKAPQLILPTSPLPELTPQTSVVCWNYMAGAVRRELAACPDPKKQLRELVGPDSNKPLLLLELLAAQSAEGDTPPVVRFLLDNLRHDLLPRLLDSPRLPPHIKVEGLASFIGRHRRFPDNCPSLWQPPPAGDGREESVSLLESAIAEVAPPILDQACRALATRPDFPIPLALAIALVRTAVGDPARMPSVDWAIDKLDDDRLCEMLQRHANRLPANFPWRETPLPRRLDAILLGLPFEPDKFDRRLALLEQWVNCTSAPASSSTFLKAWRKVRDAIELLRPEPSQGLFRLTARVFGGRQLDYSEIGRELADGMWVAMHADHYPDEPDGLLKLKCLTEIGAAVLGTPDFLPRYVRFAISSYYLSKFDGFGLWTLVSKKKRR